MENLPVTSVTIHTVHTAPPVVRATNPTRSMHPLTHAALNTIFSMIVTSSKQGRGLNWFSLTDFVNFSSSHKILAFHINRDQLWKYLLIYQNHGCLQAETLSTFNPASFKTVFLQLNRFGISFETPQLVYMVASKGFPEMMNILKASVDLSHPDLYKKYSDRANVPDHMPADPKEHQRFMAHLSRCLDQIKEECHRDGWTPLLFAAKTGNANLIRALLAYKRNTDPNHYMEYLEAHNTPSQKTALKYAVHSGNPEAVRALLEGGANTETRDRDGNTPLISSNTIEITRVLIEGKANIEAQNHSGETALMYATNSIRLLRQHEASMKANGASDATIESIFQDPLEIVKFLTLLTGETERDQT